MLKFGATEADLVAEGQSRWAARVHAVADAWSAAHGASLSPDATAAAVPYESAGPLGYQQMWCGGPDAYKAWSALPEVQAAWHVKTHTADGNMQYTRAPAGDLRPLYKTLAAKYRE
eukprot:SAG11_NODE_5277_length_1608_cov_1.106693_1_plen_116_part_10